MVRDRGFPVLAVGHQRDDLDHVDGAAILGLDALDHDLHHGLAVRNRGQALHLLIETMLTQRETSADQGLEEGQAGHALHVLQGRDRAEQAGAQGGTAGLALLAQALDQAGTQSIEFVGMDRERHRLGATAGRGIQVLERGATLCRSRIGGLSGGSLGRQRKQGQHHHGQADTVCLFH